MKETGEAGAVLSTRRYSGDSSMTRHILNSHYYCATGHRDILVLYWYRYHGSHLYKRLLHIIFLEHRDMAGTQNVIALFLVSSYLASVEIGLHGAHLSMPRL